MQESLEHSTLFIAIALEAVRIASHYAASRVKVVAALNKTSQKTRLSKQNASVVMPANISSYQVACSKCASSLKGSANISTRHTSSNATKVPPEVVPKRKVRNHTMPTINCFVPVRNASKSKGLPPVPLSYQHMDGRAKSLCVCPEVYVRSSKCFSCGGRVTYLRMPS